MFGWLKRRNKVIKSTYSIEMRTIFRECMDVVYREEGRKLYFDGEKVGKKWRQVNLGVPTNLAPGDQARVLANLGAGLEELGYEYVIFRTAESQPIPENEQRAAFAELREMGMLPAVSPDKSSVKLSRLPGWIKPADFDPQKQARRMSQLVAIVRGKRSPIEILAQSDGAERGLN
jgi:hypothetical protein